MPSWPTSRSTSSTSSSPGSPATGNVAPRAVADGVGAVVGQAASRATAAAGRRRVADAGRRQRVVVPAEEPVGREDLEPGVARSRRARPSSARSPACPPRPRTRAPSRSDGGRRRSGAAGRRTPRRRRRRAGARAACRRPSRSGSRSGHGDGRVAVVEEEDRLELGARGAQQPQPALLRAGVRALVREHRAASRTARRGARRRGPSRRRATPSGPT